MRDRKTREIWLKAHGFQNVTAIVVAAEQKDRPTIQRACALTLNESSGGYNVYGREGSTPALYGAEVTKANYKEYLAHVAAEGRNGVGPTQLTLAGYQADADKLGGCWNPLFNCEVGFRLLHELIEIHGVWGGAMRYNGSGPAAEAYADKFVANEKHLIAEGLR